MPRLSYPEVILSQVSESAAEFSFLDETPQFHVIRFMSFVVNGDTDFLIQLAIDFGAGPYSVFQQYANAGGYPYGFSLVIPDMYVPIFPGQTLWFYTSSPSLGAITNSAVLIAGDAYGL